METAIAATVLIILLIVFIIQQDQWIQDKHQ